MCSQDPIYFVVAVHSHPKNFMRRNTIRNTWGSVKRVEDWNVRLVFVLGEAPGDEKLDLLVQSESALFNDLVQGEFEVRREPSVIDILDDEYKNSIINIKGPGRYQLPSP
jgi:hypothetical protein